MEANDFINRFKRVESHYCRADTNFQYLSSDLSLPKMHRMHLDDHSEEEAVTFRFTIKG